MGAERKSQSCWSKKKSAVQGWEGVREEEAAVDHQGPSCHGEKLGCLQLESERTWPAFSHANPWCGVRGLKEKVFRSRASRRLCLTFTEGRVEQAELRELTVLD